MREPHPLILRRTRNINNNIDFGLSFPTPTATRRSKTPSTNRKVSGRPTRTPARRSVSQEPTTAAPAIPPPASTARRTSKRKSSFLDTVTAGPERATVKKRKLDDSATTPSGPSNQAINHLLSGTQESIPRRRASRTSDFIAIAEEPSDGDPQSPARGPDAYSTQDPDALPSASQEDKENDEPSLSTTQVKRRKRKSIGQSRKKRSSNGSLQEQHTGLSRSVKGKASVPRNQQDPHLVKSTASTRLPNDRDSHAEGEALPLTVRHQNGIAIPTKAPRAHPVVQQAADFEETSPASESSPIAPQTETSQVEDEDVQREDSILSVQSNGPSKKRRKRKSILVKKRGGRRVSQQSTASASPVSRPRRVTARTVSPAATPYREADEDEDESYIPEEGSPEPPTPAVNPKKSRKIARPAPNIGSNEPARRSTSTEPTESGFPITTHRLVNTSALPTITEEDEAASSDELQSHLGTSRTIPNAVDVLAQICRESVASALTSIRTSTTGSTLKRKTEALESFGKEIDSRLFDMSAAVENRLTLEGRVRASKREKSTVQARWSEVRRKREEVALRMDRMRREHWESEEEGAAAWKLSEGLQRVEVVVEREKGTETESIDYLLRSVGRGVSGWEGGGVLSRVREFNARLETMVQVLEG